MPEKMWEDEKRTEEKKAIVETRPTSWGKAGAKDIGKVLGTIMPKLKGEADGSLVSRIVKEELLK